MCVCVCVCGREGLRWRVVIIIGPRRARMGSGWGRRAELGVGAGMAQGGRICVGEGKGGGGE